MRLPHSSSLLRGGQLASFRNRHGFAATRSHSTAVLGGGITGLTAAWQLTQDPKCKQVVLYEKTKRLGGWVDSENIPVEGGNVVFEYGPRTLKSSLPSSLPTLYLVRAPARVPLSSRGYALDMLTLIDRLRILACTKTSSLPRKTALRLGIAISTTRTISFACPRLNRT